MDHNHRHDSSSRGGSSSSKQLSNSGSQTTKKANTTRLQQHKDTAPAVTQRLTNDSGIDDQNDDITAKFGQRDKLTKVRKILFVILSLAMILMLMAFFSNYWLVSDERYYGSKFDKLGLWRMCFRSFSLPSDYEYKKFYVGCRWIFTDEYRYIRRDFMPAFFIATQILFTLGFLILIFTCVGILAMQQCFVVDREDHALRILSIASLLSAICSTSAVTIFALYGNGEDWMPDPDHNNLSWSFVEAVIGCIFLWIASLLFYIETRLISNKRNKQSHSYRGTRA